MTENHQSGKLLHFPEEVAEQDGGRHQHEPEPEDAGREDVVCLSQHFGAEGDGGVDVGVSEKEQQPHHHAAPHCDVSEL